MTVVMGQLRGLADRAASRGAQALVLSRFSDDVPGELPGYLAAAEPDTAQQRRRRRQVTRRCFNGSRNTQPT